MSTPETVESPPKPDVKNKPQIPSKPKNGPTDSLPVDSDTLDKKPGKVLNIINRFNQPESTPPTGEPVNGIDSKKKKAPVPKPKPTVNSGPQLKSNEAPPLPPKNNQSRRKTLEGKKDEDQATSDDTDGQRSAPDSKEVELQIVKLSPLKDVERQNSRPSSLKEVEQPIVKPRSPKIGKLCNVRPNSLSEPQCESNCTCVCHLQRPGMKLVWVHISEQDQNCEKDKETAEEDAKKDNQSEKIEEEEEVQELGSTEPTESKHSTISLGQKKRIQLTLKDILERGMRRKSDPGLKPFPYFPAAAPGPLNKAYSVSEEDSIYESTLDLITPKETKDKAFAIPTIVVNKSLKPPPAIPPRMPVDKMDQHTPRRAPLARRPSSSERNPAENPSPQRPPPLPPAKSNSRSPKTASQLPKFEDEESPAENAEKQSQRISGITRQKSIDMEAHMPEGLLYQIYTQTHITKEIRRQTVTRNISKTSADFAMDYSQPRTPSFSSGTGAGGSMNRPIPVMKKSTLWQDQPVVCESGILDTLSSEVIKYQESMYEVLTSEVSYLRSLRVLTEHFMESRELNELLIIRDKKTLFSNILRIREVSEKFLADLEERLDQDILLTNICDIINYHAQHNFPAYIDYVRNQIYQDKTYTTLMQSNAQFATVIGFLQDAPICQRLPFTSFLLLPFQRITRIKILIENILKRTKEKTDDEEITSKALASVSKIIDECNTQVGKMRQMEELIEINNTLEFDKLKALPIISQTRFLEKRGELQEMAKGGTLFYLKPKFTPVYLFLFNDLLVIANKKGSDRYIVIDHAHRSLVQVHAMGDEAVSPGVENCFCLTLLENHQGRMMERLIKAPSQSDMHRWLAAFPNPEDPNREQEEVIYEDWDCPQVQCVEKYVATQADELNLEPPEIINVIRKTNEGWYEGIRLSDGQKGWFPVKNILEITSEHMRRRNLRERYRVMQAAETLTKT